MNIEWIAEDDVSTIGHASKLQLNGNTVFSPLHMLTSRDLLIADKHRRLSELGNNEIYVAGKSLGYSELKEVGTNPDVLETLRKDLSNKMLYGKLNIVFQRVPSGHTVRNTRIDVKSLDDFQTAGLVDIQLELKAPVIVPPEYSEISSLKQAQSIYERTKTEVQTYNTNTEIMGFIPSTHDLRLASEMVKTYVKDGIRFFGIDFSGSPLSRFMLRTVVSAIRTSLKIKGKTGERNSDKQYYLHVFDISANQKSASRISAITDILTHIYGVDSTSGVVWGGGKMVKGNLRYFDFSTYGAIQAKALASLGMINAENLVSGSTLDAYEKLRTQKNIDYGLESKKITSLLSKESDSYKNFLGNKTNATDRIRSALTDVVEIKSRI